MEIEKDNLLTEYNPVEAMSNNVTIEAIQEGPNHSDFKAVLKEYKDIQFENMKELGQINIIQHNPTYNSASRWAVGIQEQSPFGSERLDLDQTRT